MNHPTRSIEVAALFLKQQIQRIFAARGWVVGFLQRAKQSTDKGVRVVGWLGGRSAGRMIYSRE